MNPDDLREQLHRASQPPNRLIPPVAELRRRGRRRQHQRITGAFVAAVVGSSLFLGGPVAFVGANFNASQHTEEPGGFPAELPGLRLTAQQAAPAGQMRFLSPASLEAKDVHSYVSFRCVKSGYQPLELLLIWQGEQVPRGEQEEVLPCNGESTPPTRPPEGAAGGFFLVFRVPGTTGRSGKGVFQDPTAQLSAALYTDTGNPPR